MKAEKKIGIIGTGNMGAAIISGLINSSTAPPENLFAFDVDQSRLEKICADYRLNKCPNNLTVLEKAEFVILAVKPQNMPDLLTEIKPAIKSQHCLLSIVAGVRTEFIEEALGKEVRVVRAMPNMPALIGAGATAIASGRYALTEDLKLSERTFSALGIVVRVEERHLDAITALSGSGPAYFFYLIECLIEAAKKVGLPPEVAAKLTKQTALGAARLVNEATDSPQELRQKVSSPGGTTVAALEVFFAKGFKDIVLEAIQRATTRAQELSK